MRMLFWLAAVSGLFAADDFTVYELLAPSSHSFDIIYDVTQTRESALYFYNPIRQGSVATNERAIDVATGKPLELAVVRHRR
jgi:hypothetical protein